MIKYEIDNQFNGHTYISNISFYISKLFIWNLFNFNVRTVTAHYVKYIFISNTRTELQRSRGIYS